ncbi:MAG: hypothetical protein K0R84_2229, partial [Clostridia bacterium]|nr:hypothetical protein [Clostridia bacterium]
DNAKANLLREGVSETGIFITGNTAIDALKTTVKKEFQFRDPVLRELENSDKRVILVTAHRRENLGEPLRNICKALRYIAGKYEDVQVVYTMHKNPAVREIAHEILDNCKRVSLLDTLDAEEMHNAMDRSYLVLTDSGGLQEEAPSLGKPVLVVRNETERPEAIEFGTLKLAGTDKDNIIALLEELLDDKDQYNNMANAVNPYGDGNASQRIVESLLYYFGERKERPVDFKPSIK